MTLTKREQDGLLDVAFYSGRFHKTWKRATCWQLYRIGLIEQNNHDFWKLTDAGQAIVDRLKAEKAGK